MEASRGAMMLITENLGLGHSEKLLERSDTYSETQKETY